MKTSLHGIGLRYFVEVARTGSLSDASVALHVATSAISRQVAKLEEELGCQLFDRLPRGMVLTEGGRKLMAYATRSMLDGEHIANELRGLDLERTGTVRVACTQGFAYSFLPAAIASFLDGHPKVKFQLYVGSPSVVAQRVRDGESDVALSFSLRPISGVHIEHSEPASIYVLMRQDDPLASRRHLSMADLAGRHFLLPEQGTTLRELVEIAAELAGVDLDPVLESNNSYAMYAFAKKTGALMFTAIVSVSGRYEEDGFLAIPLKDDVLGRREFQIQTMSGRVLPPLLADFCEHVKVQKKLVSTLTRSRKKTMA
ncbi:LysR substrate binding domain protein [Caballeronia hypogeia]|uniref:LysR substrate binding domain protein n=1 Tax=Caballeronia hypogeia TaxID=1777140 RepID=A0A158CKS9_9BURK|nr:LysR family transcriptional regulator [Caballeronia hypogeia]SAK82476.1 LysR substrate binding domain protein [Caballeronia hypogeia]